MKYKYIAVYKINGLTPSEDRAEQVLTEYAEINAKAILSHDATSHLIELDKMALIGNNMLSGALNASGNQTYDERLEIALSEIKGKREKDLGQGVFLIFEACGHEDNFNFEHTREMQDYIISRENESPKHKIQKNYQAIINGIILSFAIATEQVYSFRKIKDGTIFINDNGKHIYSYSIEMHGTVTTSTRLTHDIASFVKKYGKTLGKHQNLISPARLLAKSLDDEIDDIQSFLSAWSGLEIFVNKNFNNFKDITFNNLSNHDTTLAPSKFFNRIKNVMEGKYKLIDKFSVISFELSPDSSEDDIKSFEEIKDIRDKFMHGNDIDISNLPTNDTTKLLRKYLKLLVESK